MRRWRAVMPEITGNFRNIQYAFAAHIRDPDRHPAPPDVSPTRMAAYRELFFNNIENFIAAGFPVLKSVMADHWIDLIQDFYARHRCQTPLFIEIAEEFLSYLQSERNGVSADPPFLLELAHYEWVELALAVAEAEPPRLDPEFSKNPLSAAIRLSETAWPLAYRFPVHKICPHFQPAEAPQSPTFLVVYRDRDDAVRFLEVNQATYRLLELLEESGTMSARDCLMRIAEELRHPDPTRVQAFGADILNDLAERGVIGTGY